MAGLDPTFHIAKCIFIGAWILWAWSWDLPESFLLNKLVQKYGRIFKWLNLTHGWRLFAPNPPEANHSIEIEVVLPNRSRHSWRFPRLNKMGIWQSFRATHDRNFESRLFYKQNKVAHAGIVDYSLRSFQKLGLQPAEVNIKLHFRTIPPIGQAGPIRSGVETMYAYKHPVKPNIKKAA
jgi:hypothetical protein